MELRQQGMASLVRNGPSWVCRCTELPDIGVRGPHRLYFRPLYPVLLASAPSFANPFPLSCSLTRPHGFRS